MSRSPDRLSDLLERFTLRADVTFAGALAAGADTGGHTPGQGVIHYLAEGAVRLALAHGPDRLIEGPCVLFVPRGDRHRLEPVAERALPRLVCGTIDFGGEAGNPLIRSMPAVVTVPLASADATPLRSTVDLMVAEAFSRRCGMQAVVDRALEILVVQLLRHLMAQGDADVGVLAGLADPGLARALTAMHRSPGEAWTVEELASTAGMSRTVFAERFRARVGMTPLGYLARWRVTLARNALSHGRPLKVVAIEVGYQSPGALSKVMRRFGGDRPRTLHASGRGPR